MKKIIILLTLIFLVGCSLSVYEETENQTVEVTETTEDGKTVKVTKRTYTKTEDEVEVMTPEKMAKKVLFDFGKADLTFIRDNMVDKYGFETTPPNYEEMVEALKEECGPNGECIEVTSVVVVSKWIATNLDEILPRGSRIDEYYEIEVKAIGEANNEMGEEFFDSMPIPIVKIGDEYFYLENPFYDAEMEEFY